VAWKWVALSLGGLLVCGSMYAVYSDRTFAAEATSIQRKWLQYEQSGVSNVRIRGLDRQLEDIENKRIGPIPAVWLGHAAEIAQKMKALNTESEKIMQETVSKERQQAVAALRQLVQTEGQWAKSGHTDREGQLNGAHTIAAYNQLAHQWRIDREKWVEAVDKLKQVSGGYTSGKPSDVASDVVKLSALLASPSFTEAEAQKGRALLAQASAYDRKSPLVQFAQHKAMVGRLHGLIANLEEVLAEKEREEFPFGSAFQQYVKNSESTVSVAVYDAVNGKTYTYLPDLQFDTASIVKVTIMGALLRQAEVTNAPLSSDAQNLMTPMIEQSDNDAATSLWNLAGDSGGIDVFLQAVGMKQTTAGQDGFWGLTQTTALDQVNLLRDFAFSNAILGDTERQYGLDLMKNVTSCEDWGVSAGVSSTAFVALKNGWLPIEDNNWQINSIGYIDGDQRNYVVAVLTRDNPTEDYGIQTVEDISKMLWDALKH